jgi:NAD(P)-dependent dehydrogenase (short-subunit alcohol dehydrogenase family)
MTRVFITGSADGLGLLAAQMLTKQGHSVVLHARSEQRAKDAMAALPQADGCLVADLSSVEEAKKLASEVNKLPRFDSIIHNVGVGPGVRSANTTPEGYAATFAVNSLAPYILTCLIQKPARLVYLSSDMHLTGKADMSVDELTWKSRRFDGDQAYRDSKLQNTLFANYIARKWDGQVLSNSVNPGWQP